MLILKTNGKIRKREGIEEQVATSLFWPARGQGKASMELGTIDHSKYGTRYKKKY
jgi:hypothetical protein